MNVLVPISNKRKINIPKKFTPNAILNNNAFRKCSFSCFVVDLKDREWSLGETEPLLL